MNRIREWLGLYTLNFLERYHERSHSNTQENIYRNDVCREQLLAFSQIPLIFTL